MLEEIGKRPGATEAAAAANGGTKEGGTFPEDRESYALAAGLAIGLITLGKGRSTTGLSDMRIEERLRCVSQSTLVANSDKNPLIRQSSVNMLMLCNRIAATSLQDA